MGGPARGCPQDRAALVGGTDPGPARGCPCQPLPSKDLQLQARLPALRSYPKQLLRAIHPRGQMVTTSIAGEVLVAVRPRGTRFELIILDLSDQMYFVKSSLDFIDFS